LYILECGQGHTGDMSRWTPGQNVNVPKDINHDKPQRESLKLAPAAYE
jgi:hypothetical protein